MKSYRNLDLELTDWTRDAAGGETLRVRVAASPEGEQRRAEASPVAFDAGLRAQCGAFDRRELGAAGLVELGRALGDLLLPDAVRRLYARCRAGLAEGEGLRLRLKIDAVGIADLPWELVWLPPHGDGAAAAGAGVAADATGFLALDQSLSLVRYELLDEPLGVLDPVRERALRLVALFAPVNDPQWPVLDLGHEADALADALAGRDDLIVDLRRRGTVAELEAALAPGAHIFHFAGHGRFAATLGERPGTIEGEGFLELCAEDGRAAEMPADALAVNLRGRGVRLVVLGACEGARRDGVNPWSGIAPALVRCGLPAVVAMQATLRDANAVELSRSLYEALGRGEPIDAAVAAGRLAVFNRSGAGERDWAVAALYLRAESGVLFPVESDAESLAKPLGLRGWTNAALSGIAVALAALALDLAARPRIPSWWLAGGVALALGAAFGYVRWLAEDDVRAAVRRLLRRRWSSPVLGAVTAALALLVGALWWMRPVVLRIVPGTCLRSHLPTPGAAPAGPGYSLRVWQGSGEDPSWTVESLEQPGVALGAPAGVTAAMLLRADALMLARMEEYLDTRGVQEAARKGWLKRWRLPEPGAGSARLARSLRAGPEPRFELRHGDQVVPLVEPVVVERLGNALEETVEIVFLEPVDAQCK